MKTLKDFTDLYNLPKTLRFELKPVGKTLEHFLESDILSQDEHRAESYVEVKKNIDNYHKAYIESSLKHFFLKYQDEGKKDSLSEYYLYYHIKDKEEQRTSALKKIQDNLRKQIADKLTKNDAYSRIFKKELIKDDLLEFVTKSEDKARICEFKDFTTYFTGFHENRKNMYSSDEKSTAIAYRLIHQNLPKFIDNMDVFEKIETPLQSELIQLYKELEDYLNVGSISEMFNLGYYSILLTQTQIDVYNTVIGGRAIDEHNRIQGLNEYINLYNQQHDKSEKLPKFKSLYKQILSDRDAISFLPEEFKDDNQTLESIEEYYRSISNVLDKNANGRSLKELLCNLKDYDLKQIYITNDSQLTDISQKMFGSWEVIQKALEKGAENSNPQKKKESLEKYEERISKTLKSSNSFSIDYLNHCIDAYNVTPKHIDYYFAELGAVNTEAKHEDDLFTKIKNAYANVSELLNTQYPESKDLAQEKDDVEKIKALLDTIKDLQRFIKPLLGKGTEPEKDEKFYGEFMALWDVLDKVTPLYNKVRNRMTRKPYSTEKIKLNFQNAQLLNGWDVNKEKEDLCIILRKDGLYYLGIIKKGSSNIFDVKDYGSDKEYYEKMEYKLLPGANKMLPKVFFSGSRIREFNPSEQLLKNYEKGTHKKGAYFNIDDCRALIDFFKNSIQKHEDWKNFNFQFSDTATYDDLSGFYREVEQQGYKLSFRNIPVNYVSKLVDEGKLYLFQIYNKDFSPYSKGTPNMHTLYWKALFDERNLQDVVYKLNGQAEIFYRKSSIKDGHKIVHPANHAIANKSTETQKEKPSSVFKYDLIKDRRYTVDKFQFHVPITINFKSSGNGKINDLTNEYLKNNDVTHIIGIDRGERHLLYLTLIDLKGNIIKQFSLNDIVNEYNGNTYKTNYHDLLDKKEEERATARKSWKTIENIKELKEGYLSQVIHTMSQLIVKYNAIVVLEDLNGGFIRGRQKVEKQVYQKFEKMLIDKLNYLVDKQKDMFEPGGVMKALQLTSKFESFQKLYKQSGILFYIPAWNTSKMDPTTGFVNLFDTRYETIEKAKSFFGKFDSIRYNMAKDWFEFAFDYNNFTTKAEGSRAKWTLCTFGPRIKTFRDSTQISQWNSIEENLTDEFKRLFKDYHINYTDGDIKELICNQTEKTFFQGLYSLLRLTLQMRNSKTRTEIDYMISPVADESGNFFDSRTCRKGLPDNADANGAYNIARKGLWILQKINEATDMKGFKIPAMTNKEWLSFAQKRPYLDK
jgi:CRISPR-associated protein Cpf1